MIRADNASLSPYFYDGGPTSIDRCFPAAHAYEAMLIDRMQTDMTPMIAPMVDFEGERRDCMFHKMLLLRNADVDCENHADTQRRNASRSIQPTHVMWECDPDLPDTLCMTLLVVDEHKVARVLRVVKRTDLGYSHFPKHSYNIEFIFVQMQDVEKYHFRVRNVAISISEFMECKASML